MPTVLLMDVSLSMARSCGKTPGSNSTEESTATTKKALAVHGIYKYLECIGKQSKLEYISLMIYSSLWEVVVPFTRDYDLIKSAADSVQLYDKTCLYEALQGAIAEIQSTWGSSLPSQVVIFTDGIFDSSSSSVLTEKLSSLSVDFPCQFHMFCLSCPDELGCSDQPQALKTMMETIGAAVSCLDGLATFSCVDEMVQEYTGKSYKSYSGLLCCGNMKSSVQLHPPPTSTILEDDFTHEELEFPGEMSIVGFISQADMKSPPCLSRHLVLPLPIHTDLNNEVEQKAEDGKTASFVVLLHGALKIDSKVAITKLRDNWYGMLHSWADSKKKSNLVLSLFKPGLCSVPWLGDLSNLGLPTSPYQGAADIVVTQISGLPVPNSEKKSYSSQSPSWLRQATLQSDIQKLLRYGRKLPDKLIIFYKELNRIHKAAVSIGFHQLLSGLSHILERECTLLPPTAHPDASIQLQHAASLLVRKEVLNMNYIIQPLSTNFKPSDS